MNVNDEAKKRVDDLCKKSYPEIVEQMKQGSITDTITDSDGYEYQLEISLIWDDKKKGVIRVSAFLDGGPSKHWWSSFVSKSSYEKFVYPK